MARRHSMRICSEGWYYLFVVLFIIGGAVLGEVNLLIMLAGMMVGPFLFNWRFVQLTLQDLTVARRLPQRVCVGETLTVAVTAENHRRRLTSWTVMVEDRLVRDGDPDPDHVRTVRLVLPRIPAGRNCTGHYRTQPLQRGRYSLGPLRVSTRFPLGLVRASMLLESSDSFLVYPQLGRLTQRWLQIVNARLVGSQSEGRHQGVLEGDYYGLREWRSGDSRRWIHWRTSAKLGELSVRQFEQQRNRDLVLVLDLWEPDAPTAEERATTEVAVSFLATGVADVCGRGGSRVVVSVAGRESRFWSGAASTLLAQDVLDHLSEALAGDGLGIYSALDQVRQVGTGGAHILVISTRSAPFLTSGDDWESNVRRPSQPHTYGNLTWVDCRSEALRQYFILPVARCSGSERPSAEVPAQ